jgi:hypothetical protein
MAAQEGIARLNRLSVYLAYCALAGMVLWLSLFITIGRLGIGELVVLTFGPILVGGTVRAFSWLLAGFLLD